MTYLEWCYEGGNHEHDESEDEGLHDDDRKMLSLGGTAGSKVYRSM